MDTSKGIIPLIPRSLTNGDQIKTINLYFHAFYNPNIKFSTKHTFVSLVTPEGPTNTRNHHYTPVGFSCNGNVVHSSSNTDHSYDIRTGGSGRYYSPLSFVLFPVAMVTNFRDDTPASALIENGKQTI
ncbi:unnamed protein product [Arctogadus glacialis]